MPNYVLMPKGKQKELFEQIKTAKRGSFKELAKLLGVHKTMITHYAKERAKLQYENFLKLCSFARIDNSKIVYCLKSIPRNLDTNIPKIDAALAEFIGILLGDGHLDPKKFKIVVTCGLIDQPYITAFVPSLMHSLFGKKPTIKKISNVLGQGVQCWIYSKKAFDFLKSEGVPPGKKMHPEIPRKFFENKDLLRACIRGLIDTDGGVYRHHNTSIQIVFYSKTESLADSVCFALQKLRYSPSYSRGKKLFSIALFEKDAEQYFETIGSHNAKNNVKYAAWKQTGRVPNQEFIEPSILK